MTDCCANVGALSKLAIGGTRIDFIDFDPVRVVRTLSDGSEKAIRGTLDHGSTAVASGIVYVDFRIGLYVTKQKMDLLLPIMGMPESPSDTFKLGSTLPETTVILGPAGSPEVTFAGAKVGRWVMRGTRGSDPVRLDLWFRAKTRAENPAGTFFISNTNPAMTEGPLYSFTAGTMNLKGATRYFHQFAIGMDYRLAVEFNNSVTATSICPTDHGISVGTGLLYSTCDGNTDVVTDPFADGDIEGDSFELEFTRLYNAQTYTTGVSIGNVKLIPSQPGVQNKFDFLRAAINGRGYAVGTSPAMIFNNSVA